MTIELTRRELKAELDRAYEETNKLARETEVLRKELGYHQQRLQREVAHREQLTRDRDRLTATVEVLARRIASDSHAYLVGVDMAEAPAKNEWTPRH